jgi:hypothetical protein
VRNNLMPGMVVMLVISPDSDMPEVTAVVEKIIL